MCLIRKKSEKCLGNFESDVYSSHVFITESTCLVFFSVYAHTIQVFCLLLQHSFPPAILGALKDASLFPVSPIELIVMDI